MVKDIKRVVVMTAEEEMLPLCPMFLAIMKLELVVALPSIIRAATSFSSLKPRKIARGRNRMQNKNSLLKTTRRRGFSFSFMFLNSKLAPNAISARGEATLAR